MVAHLAVGGDEHDELVGAGVELDVVEADDVGRVGGGDGDLGAVALQHEHTAALGDGAGEQTHGLRHDHGATEVDERQAEGLGERLGDLALGRVAGRDDDGAEARAGLAGRRGLLHLEDL